MAIQLTPKAESIIKQKVQRGLYANAETAIDVAMQLLDEHDRRLSRLREAIAEGEVGEAVPWTPDLMEEIQREADDMRRRGEAPDPEVCP